MTQHSPPDAVVTSTRLSHNALGWGKSEEAARPGYPSPPGSLAFPRGPSGRTLSPWVTLGATSPSAARRSRVAQMQCAFVHATPQRSLVSANVVLGERRVWRSARHSALRASIIVTPLSTSAEETVPESTRPAWGIALHEAESNDDQRTRVCEAEHPILRVDRAVERQPAPPPARNYLRIERVQLNEAWSSKSPRMLPPDQLPVSISPM